MIKEFTGNYLNDCLSLVCSQIKPKSYLEIGVNDGRSLFSVIKDTPDLQKIYLCDTWGGKYGGKKWGSHDHIEEGLKKIGFDGEVVYLDGDSRLKIPEYFKGGGCIDLVNVDGDHSIEGAKKDLYNVLPLTKCIVFDDIIHPKHSYLEGAWDEFVKNTKPYFHMKYMKGHGVGVAFYEEEGVI